MTRMTPDLNPLPRALSLAVHELRTPVTVVTGYLRMLLREQGGPLTEKQRKMLEEAERSCGRIGALVSEMSDLGRLESNQLAFGRQEFDLSALLAELASRMHEGADRGVGLEVRGNGGPVMLAGDRARLGAALGSLMHSALRERGDPGVVVVQYSARSDDDRPWVFVVIGDDAVLPSLAASTPEASAPFDEWRGGLGLALPVARRVIEAHGGAVWSLAGSQTRAASALRLPLRE